MSSDNELSSEDECSFFRNSEEAVAFNYVRDVNGGNYVCPRCHVEYKSKLYRDKHYKTHFTCKNIKCPYCEKPFKQKCRMELHKKNCLQKCYTQAESIYGNTNTIQHGYGLTDSGDINDGGFIEHENALGIIRKERVTFSSSEKNLIKRLEEAFKKTVERLEIEKESMSSLKVYLSLQVNFYKSADPSVVTNPSVWFNTEPIEFLIGDNTTEVVQHFQNNLMQQIDNYERNGSGWVLANLVTLDLTLCKFK